MRSFEKKQSILFTASNTSELKHYLQSQFVMSKIDMQPNF